MKWKYFKHRGKANVYGKIEDDEFVDVNIPVFYPSSMMKCEAPARNSSRYEMMLCEIQDIKSKKNVNWEDWEVEILKNNVLDETILYLLPNRTLKQIRNKVRFLGLTFKLSRNSAGGNRKPVYEGKIKKYKDKLFIYMNGEYIYLATYLLEMVRGIPVTDESKIKFVDGNKYNYSINNLQLINK